MFDMSLWHVRNSKERQQFHMHSRNAKISRKEKAYQKVSTMK